MDIKLSSGKKFSLILCTFFLFVCFYSFAQNSAQTEKSTLGDGLEAYRSGDWTSAVFFFRKAISLKKSDSPETLYMLIMAEMYNGDYKNASSDCDVYTSRFPNSVYAPYVQYQKGRSAYYLGDYNRAVLLLSDFCHNNSENEMYPSALFWIAESFYAGYNYDFAKALYERIVTDFPLDAKAAEAQYKIEMIDQRSREEKLIYLLKMTGEEYLAAKEDYERQLKEYKTEGLVGLQRQLKTEQDKVASLSAALEEQQKKNAELQSTLNGLQSKTSTDNPDILELKRKAKEIQGLMESSSGE